MGLKTESGDESLVEVQSARVHKKGEYSEGSLRREDRMNIIYCSSSKDFAVTF